MKIGNLVVLSYGLGTCEFEGDAVKLNIKLSEEESAEIRMIGWRALARHQDAIAKEVKAAAPLQLEAPTPEPEYTSFTPVPSDDEIPF